MLKGLTELDHSGETTMKKWLYSAINIGVMVLFLNVSVFSAFGQAIVTEQQVIERYKQRGAELAACKGDLACIDKVKMKHYRENQSSRDFLRGRIDYESYISRRGGKSLPEKGPVDGGQSQSKSEKLEPRTWQEQVSAEASPKTDEFDLGDLDF